jgi:hypothetical protein
MYYLAETDLRGAMGLGGLEQQGVATIANYLTAIDYKTSKAVWRHRYPGPAAVERVPCSSAISAANCVIVLPNSVSVI